MRLIKLALISVLLLFFVVTAISLLIPSQIRISKAINIHSSEDSIFALIRDTAKWKQWHPAFIPNDSAPKFPAIHIAQKSESDSEIIMHLQQSGKPEVVNGWKIYRYPHVDSLTLQWYMDFNLKWYPWQKFGSMFYEKTYGAMMEKGLENIRELTNK
ncbi:MAG: hypothetical protein J7502_08230 [Flavisolibacter sp.]|nr:hypothetical protein [Flavisolibacter sp.]